MTSRLSHRSTPEPGVDETERPPPPDSGSWRRAGASRRPGDPGSVRQAFEPVTAQHQHISHAPVAEEGRPLRSITPAIETKAGITR